jgi:hypothetical protein
MLMFAGIDPLMVQLIQSRVSVALSKDCAAAAALKRASVEVVSAAAAAGAELASDNMAQQLISRQPC